MSQSNLVPATRILEKSYLVRILAGLVPRYDIAVVDETPDGTCTVLIQEPNACPLLRVSCNPANPFPDVQDGGDVVCEVVYPVLKPGLDVYQPMADRPVSAERPDPTGAVVIV